jgi:AcrR family transcriptional regulator
MATLDDIVSAAAKVFRTKGHHAATVRDIAEEVGILKGSLYHHFASKRSCSTCRQRADRPDAGRSPRSPPPIWERQRSFVGRFRRTWRRSIGTILTFLSISASARR